MAIRFLVEDHYRKVRGDASFWQPLVEEALRQNQVSIEPMTSIEQDGTNANFWFGADKVLKIYTPFFGGRESRGMEVAALKALQLESGIPVPRIISKGDLEPLEREWKWPWVLLERMHGRTLEVMWPSLTTVERHRFAFELGSMLRRMHQVVPGGDLSQTYQSIWPKGFAEFLTRQHQLVSNQPELAVIPVYEEILRMSPTGVVSGWPVLLHGDLDGSHILVNDGAITGLIDFGDAKLGDPVYDFIPIHHDLFGMDRSLFAEFLKGYGLNPATEPRFRDRLITYTILHEWGFAGRLTKWTVQSGATTLGDLALWMWG
ncbi:MAG: aminoglycoside phosphotransferase family protein [Fimbriimonadaceae bacterium]